MPSKRSAVAALQKLEADRLALDQRQKELEKQAALELGSVILGTGLETFSQKGLAKAAVELAKLGEDEALRCGSAQPLCGSSTDLVHDCSRRKPDGYRVRV